MYGFKEGDPRFDRPFLLEVNDRRRDKGVLVVDVGEVEGKTDLLLKVIVEIGRLHDGLDDLACVQVRVDESNLSASLWRQGDRLLLRLDEGETLKPTSLANGKSTYSIVYE